MNVITTALPGVLILEPVVFSDARGFFMESYNARTFAQITGINAVFVQDNHSRSQKNVLRGLHYQIQQPQGKLVRVIDGEIYDVVVDIRRHSPTFGQWMATTLSAVDKRQLWVPIGYAHGFLTVSPTAEVLYKITDYYAPEYERCIAWNDPDINISWPLTEAPTLSAKDQQGAAFKAAEVFP